MRLYLVRHGETEPNRQRRYVGWQDPPLTPAGRAQAAALAHRLAGEPVQAILASDLARALQTAAPIAAAHGLPVRPDPGLREASFGAFEGLTYAEIASRHPAELEAWLSDPEHTAPPGGESLCQLRSRLLRALPRRSAGIALLVTHGGPIRALLQHFTGRPFWEPRIPPGSLTILDLSEERPTSHTEEPPAAHLS